MTNIPTDVKLMVWFYQGFQPMSALMALFNLALIFNLWVTAKGFYISTWTIPLIATGLLASITIIGYLLQRYEYTQRMWSFNNKTQNQEMAELIRKVDAICDDLGIEVKK